MAVEKVKEIVDGDLQASKFYKDVEEIDERLQNLQAYLQQIKSAVPE